MNRSSYKLKEKVVIIYNFIKSKDTCRIKNTKENERQFSDKGKKINYSNNNLDKSHSQGKSNKMQQCVKILFHIFVKLEMFRATHRPSSEA
jgi:hypothetical protein